MLSNSDPKNENSNDEFFDILYKDYNIKLEYQQKDLSILRFQKEEK